VEEVSRPGASVAAVADRHGMSRSLLFEWRRQVREGTMLGVVRALADRVGVLYQGRLCEIGPTEAVYATPLHPYTEALLAASPEADPDTVPRLLAADIVESGASARGCPFQRRCARHLGPVCDNEMPPGRLAANGHAARCHLQA
jgi:peptide/nickel transport system ATP-binding protein